MGNMPFTNSPVGFISLWILSIILLFLYIVDCIDVCLRIMPMTYGTNNPGKARIFLLVDLREIFFRSRVGGTKKINKKALKMTS